MLIESADKISPTELLISNLVFSYAWKQHEMTFRLEGNVQMILL